MCQSDLRRNSPLRPNQLGGIEEERILSKGKGDRFVEENKTEKKKQFVERKRKKKGENKEKERKMRRK